MSIDNHPKSEIYASHMLPHALMKTFMMSFVVTVICIGEDGWPQKANYNTAMPENMGSDAEELLSDPSRRSVLVQSRPQAK